MFTINKNNKKETEAESLQETLEKIEKIKKSNIFGRKITFQPSKS